VRGFRRAVFSGLTTGALAEVLARVLGEHGELSGVWHVAADPINKFDLLSLVREAYGLRVEIEPDETFACDRSLDGSRFRRETGIRAPSWPEMVGRLRADPTPYDEIRRANAS
jgi:dTDP-4-dehydrorhamnose reductase